MVTDEDQQVVWRADYRPFGEVDITTDTLDQALRFPGQYAEDDTGLYYNYYRDYDPSIGRYIQSDPIGLGGGVNTYVYAEQNPIMLTDPNGLQAQAAGLCCIPGVGWVGCAAAAVGIGGATLLCYMTGACQNLSNAISDVMSSTSSNVDESDCEKDCGLQADAQILICDMTVGIDYGKHSKTYKTCTDRVNANYVECMQECAEEENCD